MKNKCECVDSMCPVHEGINDCKNKRKYLLMRIDMYDKSGVWMCNECADDALNSGLFRGATVSEKVTNY